MTKSIGFLFGAGAEISYGMPSGGRFALDVFRRDSAEDKQTFKDFRENIDKSTAYANNWLPDDFDKLRVSAFGQKVFETIIRDTIGNNREIVIEKINDFDKIAHAISGQLFDEKHKPIDLDKRIELDFGKTPDNINVSQQIQYSNYFDTGNGLFKNNYFAVLLKYYLDKNILEKDDHKELGQIIKAICQLQIGAMSEHISRTIEDSIFAKEELGIDLFDDLGGSLSVNYESAGVKGLEILSEVNTDNFSHPILQFSYKILERIYADVLDYKSLIDDNWHYLYSPRSEWAKFCKIAIFLYTVQSYILSQSQYLKKGRTGYYDDLYDALQNNTIGASVLATTNYSNFIQEKTHQDVLFLNGGVDEYYDPYLNVLGAKSALEKNEKHFLVPLLFTQSGTKPMTSIDMSIKYVDFYHELKDSDMICTVGFGFNYDDEHVNGIIRTLIERDDKHLVVIQPNSEKSINEAKSNLVKRLKTTKSTNVHVIHVNPETRKDCEDKLWIQCVKDISASV